MRTHRIAFTQHTRKQSFVYWWAVVWVGVELERNPIQYGILNKYQWNWGRMLVYLVIFCFENQS